MQHTHSEGTHRSLLAKIPEITGRGLPEWFQTIDEGPELLRLEERVSWLRDEHALSHGHATALVFEHQRRRTAKRV
jgi:hypothetical protein